MIVLDKSTVCTLLWIEALANCIKCELYNVEVITVHIKDDIDRHQPSPLILMRLQLR